MKSICTCLFIGAVLLADVSHGQDEKAYDFRRIQSLDQIQGHWVFVPKGQYGLVGSILHIEGKKGTLELITDLGPNEPNRKEVNLAVIDGALIVQGGSRDDPKQRWQLAQLGEHKCLVRMYADDRLGGQPLFRVAVLYLNEPDESKGDDADGN